MSSHRSAGSQSTHAYQNTSGSPWHQQLLREELVRLRKDYATVKGILVQARNDLFTAEEAARHLHQATIQHQMQKVSHLQAVLQIKKSRRESIYQAQIDHYRSKPYRLLLLVSALLGATLPQALVLSDVRDLRRLRDLPSEEEQHLSRELQREFRALDMLQLRSAPPETTQVRHCREQVRTTQSYLSELHRQIRFKEVELASLQILQKRAHQGYQRQTSP